MSSMFPLTGAAEDLWFETNQYTTSVTSLLSCSRASIGYAKNSDGTLTSFGTNTLRIGVGTGLLTEEARTNSMPNSQTPGSWNLFNATLTSSTETAPDGTATAGKFTENSGAGTRHQTYMGSNVATSTTPWVASVYVNGGTRRYVALNTNNGTSNNAKTVVLDTQTGTVTDTQGSPTYVVEALASGWYRISIATPQTTDTNTSIVIAGSDVAVPSSYTLGIPVYNGDGASYFLAWGAQQEDNVTFASSYIPTTSAAATRAADAILCTGNANTILSTLPHSSVIDIMSYVAPTGTLTILGDDTHGPVDLYSQSSNSSVNSYDGSGHSLFATFGSGLFTTGAKAAVGLSSGARSVAGNAGTVATDAFAVAGTSGSIYLGSGAASFRIWNGYIRRATFWNSKLADATLQDLTDPNSSYYAELATLFAQACL